MSTPVKQRLLTINDIERIEQLEQILFPSEDPWSAATLQSAIESPSTCYIGCEQDSLIIAYGGIAQLGPVTDPEFEIHTIGVDPDYQGKGIGRQLLQSLLGIADHHRGPVFLEVRCDNDTAINLYESVGFTVLETRRNYYHPSGADAFTMYRPAALDTKNKDA